MKDIQNLLLKNKNFRKLLIKLINVSLIEINKKNNLSIGKKPNPKM